MPIVVQPGETETPPELAGRYAMSSLVEEMLDELSGRAVDMGHTTHLLDPLAQEVLDVRVDSPSQFSSGIAEIGNELVRISRATDSGFLVSPLGRGYRATQAQDWPANTEVTFGPRFPRAAILRAINDTLAGVYPKLWGAGEVEFLVDGVQRMYGLPADAVDVLGVRWKPVGPSGLWQHVNRYRFNANPPDEVTTGKSVDFPYIPPGRQVQVRYMKKPASVGFESDFTDCGLETSAWRCIRYGAIATIIATQTAGSLERESAQAAEFNRSGRRPLSVEVSQQYYAYYQQYLAEEQARIRQANPTRNNFRT